MNASVTTLHPGDVACAERGERLATLLGSCVAIVLTDPRRTVGVMCHIVHAHGAPMLLQRMHALLRARAVDPHQCEAYVYGGGNMFPALFGAAHVGEHNAAWALRALAEDGVRVLHTDLGGASYRRLAWTVGPEGPQVQSVAISPE